MQQTTTDSDATKSIQRWAQGIFTEQQQGIFKRTDQMFAVLMAFQWIAGIAAALWISPRTWAGQYNQTHIHVWAAVFLGGLISIFPIILVLTRSGYTSTRYVIAVAQMLMSALLIHLTGGRIETHFHVFGSLAFLSFYRDWRVLVPATVVVAADHFLRGILWPQSVYGVLAASHWRWLEHAGWVLFENVFLCLAIHRNVGEMWNNAEKMAEIKGLNEGLEHHTTELAAANRELEKEITERERTEEALRESEERLRQSQKMEALGQLAGGVAHDFNNLLTVITGYSDLTLQRLTQDNPLRHSIEEIRKAGERAASLTGQLLAFSRKQVLQPKVLNLNAVVSDIDTMLRRLIGEDINLQTVLDPALKSIKADPGQIEQVILNLAVNARDAISRGGKLTIETANTYLSEGYARQHGSVRSGHYVMLAVSDNGCGMDEATRSRIFEPFFTTKEVGKGTGLGLSTVYGIVKQSEGNIWISSEVGKGTTFKVYLPQVGEVVEEHKQSAADAQLSQEGEMVLLVEDEDMARQMVRLVLEMNGYAVLEASRGKEALLICERHEGRIDLMVTDVVMPQMSGRELAECLAASRPETKVLYMSGYTDDAIVHHGVSDENGNFLQKPFTADALANKVREVLSMGS